MEYYYFQKKDVETGAELFVETMAVARLRPPYQVPGKIQDSASTTICSAESNRLSWSLDMMHPKDIRLPIPS
jgi:hypothetical protein